MHSAGKAKLGQNFLTSQSAAEDIVAALGDVQIVLAVRTLRVRRGLVERARRQRFRIGRAHEGVPPQARVDRRAADRPLVLDEQAHVAVDRVLAVGRNLQRDRSRDGRLRRPFVCLLP